MCVPIRGLFDVFALVGPFREGGAPGGGVRPTAAESRVAIAVAAITAAAPAASVVCAL